MRRNRSSIRAVDESAGDALLDAVTRGKCHLARFILDAVNDPQEAVNTRDFKGKTPLIRAVYITEEKSRTKVLQLLLGRGAQPNFRDDLGRTAISYACELRHNDIVKMLTKWNVDPDIPDSAGQTPLMYCSIVGNDVGIRILIQCFRRLGLDIDRENNDGFTALHLAAKNGYTECASRLAVEGHASVLKPDRNKHQTAEEWARQEGCTTPEVELFGANSQQHARGSNYQIRSLENRQRNGHRHRLSHSDGATSHPNGKTGGGGGATFRPFVREALLPSVRALSKPGGHQREARTRGFIPSEGSKQTIQGEEISSEESRPEDVFQGNQEDPNFRPGLVADAPAIRLVNRSRILPKGKLPSGPVQGRTWGTGIIVSTSSMSIADLIAASPPRHPGNNKSRSDQQKNISISHSQLLRHKALSRSEANLPSQKKSSDSDDVF